MKNRRPLTPFLRVVACLLIAAGLTACRQTIQAEVRAADQPRVTPAPSNYSDIPALTAGNNQFAFDLYQKLRASDGNLFYSPFSVSEALAMVYAGARGQTATQMAQTLHFTLPQERLHPAFNALDRMLASRAAPLGGQQSARSPFELHVANAVWGQSGLPYLKEFLSTLAANYGAGMRLADFKRDPQAAVERINAWVNQETQARIPKIVDQIDAGTGLLVVNAVYFNAEWSSPFDASETHLEPFHLLDGAVQAVPMMHQENRFRYTAGDGYQAVQLPYLYEDVAMLILLPEDGRFREVEQRLNNDLIQKTVGGLVPQDVVLTMPKYRFDAELALDKTLRDMGMVDAFGHSADFSGLVSMADYRASLTKVLHKAFVDVNEQRTEAAAVTKVEATVAPSAAGAATPPPPIIMKIDRPFIFVIRDVGTNAIVFVGRVMNPPQ